MLLKIYFCGLILHLMIHFFGTINTKIYAVETKTSLTAADQKNCIGFLTKHPIYRNKPSAERLSVPMLV